MRVAFFFSGGATGLKTAYEDNPLMGSIYDVDFCFTDKPLCDGAQWARERGLEVLDIDYREFIEGFPSREEGREAYFREINSLLGGRQPDLIVTTGFMLLIPEGFIKGHYGKIINGHPAKTYILRGPGGDLLEASDLSTRLVNESFVSNGYERRFVGDNAVYDAVVAGEEDVRTAVFFMDEGMDTGPNIVHSPPLEVDRERVEWLIGNDDHEGLRKYAENLQERLKFEGDRPAINRALELAALGRLGFDGETVYLDDKPLPYGGLLMEK